MGHRMTCHTTPKNIVWRGEANTLPKGATPPPPPTGAVGGGVAAYLDREVVGQTGKQMREARKLHNHIRVRQ